MKILKRTLAFLLCCVIIFGINTKIFAQETTEKVISATAFLSENQVIVNVVSEGFEEKSIAIAVLLNSENNIICVDSENIQDKLQITFPVGITGTRVKLFLWNGLKNMQPLCDVINTDVVENEFYGKTLYVDGDSICYGNGYTGGYGKIIADKYGMKLINNGVGGATISNMCTVNKVEYGTPLDWENTEYYIKMPEYDPFADINLESFLLQVTKEQYENGFGVYPTAYRMIDGKMTELEYSEEVPIGRFYLKFEVPTYGDNTVTKYYRMWRFKDGNGNFAGNYWFWEAYKNGFKKSHEAGDAFFGTARHWLSESVNDVDSSADYIIFEGGINDYITNRPLGELTNGNNDVVNTTTVIGGLEYVCRILKEKCLNKKLMYVITPKAKEFTYTPNSVTAGSKTWRDYHDAIVSVLEKYEIQYVDLFETEFDTSKEEYLIYTRNKDGVHPTKEGYEKFYVPYIVEAMRK